MMLFFLWMLISAAIGGTVATALVEVDLGFLCMPFVAAWSIAASPVALHFLGAL